MTPVLVLMMLETVSQRPRQNMLRLAPKEYYYTRYPRSRIDARPGLSKSHQQSIGDLRFRSHGGFVACHFALGGSSLAQSFLSTMLRADWTEADVPPHAG